MPARRRRQRRRERRPTATAPREEATAPTTIRRECEQPRTTHRIEGASRRHERAVAKRHAAASAAARPTRRQERQRGARKGSAAPQAAAPRVSRDCDRPQSGSDRADDHTRNARDALHYAPRQESEPPPRKSGGRAPRRRERSGTTEPVLGAPSRTADGPAISSPGSWGDRARDFKVADVNLADARSLPGQRKLDFFFSRIVHQVAVICRFALLGTQKKQRRWKSEKNSRPFVCTFRHCSRARNHRDAARRTRSLQADKQTELRPK